MSVENENNKTIAAETSIIKLIIVREFDKYHLCFIKSIKLSTDYLINRTFCRTIFWLNLYVNA